MKILLINPPIREWSKPNVFPLGLGYIAAILLQEGYRVDVWDINACRFSKEEVEDKVRHADFDVVGIGGIITTYKYIKWLAGIFKKYHPEKKLIIGGSVGTSIPQIMLKRNPVDIICMGEGEETVKELMRTLEKKKDLSEVKDICYKDDAGKIYINPRRAVIENLDTLPLPAWELFPMDVYLQNPVGAPNRNKWIDGSADKATPLSMNISATRGCPYQCIYCYHDFMGERYRNRSPQSVVGEIKILYERYNILYFHFIDDEFALRKDFVYEFCRLIKSFNSEIGNKITWGCTGRVNLVTEDMVATMADAGCVLLGYGIESGSQKMLDLIKKRVTVEQAKQAVRWTQQHMGWVSISLMIGYPGETRETIQETIDFCNELDLTPQTVFFLTPYPGTELYQMALKQGKIKDEEEYILNLGEQGEKVNANFTNFTDEELYAIQENIIKDLDALNKVKHSKVS